MTLWATAALTEGVSLRAPRSGSAAGGLVCGGGVLWCSLILCSLLLFSPEIFSRWVLALRHPPRALAMSVVEDAATALHLLRGVLDLGGGIMPLSSSPRSVSATCASCSASHRKISAAALLGNRSSVTLLLRIANRRRIQGNNRRSETLASDDFLLPLCLATRRSFGH